MYLEETYRHEIQEMKWLGRNQYDTTKILMSRVRQDDDDTFKRAG